MVVTTGTTVAIVTVTMVEAILATTRNMTTILTAMIAMTDVFCSVAVVVTLLRAEYGQMLAKGFNY